MNVVVIGSGLVGTAAGLRLREAGHHVVVTTTTPSRIESLRERFEAVYVLRGSDTAAVHALLADADAVVVTAGPAAARAMTPEDRAATYDDVLVQTAHSVVGAGGSPHLVALSALSVYGSAADSWPAVTEEAPVTTSADPSPVSFLEMERVYLGAAGDRSCVFRCGDVYGADDPPIEDKVAMAHRYLGGSVPFGAAALFYRLHVSDAADAVAHAIEHRLTGLYNLTHPEVPPTNAELFDAISVQQGLAPLTYRDEIAAPAAPVSVDRLAHTGFVARRSSVRHPKLITVP